MDRTHRAALRPIAALLRKLGTLKGERGSTSGPVRAHRRYPFVLPRFESLEPRLLLSADPLGVAVTAVGSDEPIGSQSVTLEQQPQDIARLADRLLAGVSLAAAALGPDLMLDLSSEPAQDLIIRRVDTDTASSIEIVDRASDNVLLSGDLAATTLVTLLTGSADDVVTIGEFVRRSRRLLVLVRSWLGHGHARLR